MNTANEVPSVKEPGRVSILDILCGITLMGICMDNFQEMYVHANISQEMNQGIRTTIQDAVTQWMLSIFIEGKFYTLFSLLFGIGFCRLIRNMEQIGADPYPRFYRQMTILLCVGFLNLLLIWHGDILILYTLAGGMFPLFRNLSGKWLLRLAGFFLLLPLMIDCTCKITHRYPAYWIPNIDGEGSLFQFGVHRVFMWMREIVEGNHFWRILGLFLIGIWIERNQFYIHLEKRRKMLTKVFRYSLAVGLPYSLLYIWSVIEKQPVGLTMQRAFYLMGTYSLSVACGAGVMLVYLKTKEGRSWKWLSMMGRMALTNYIGQSVLGILLFYTIGLGKDIPIGLLQVELMAFIIYLVQLVLSLGWMSKFTYGPLERIWEISQPRGESR